MNEAAEIKWDTRADYVNNILDLRPGNMTVIIGTVYKEQKAKPEVFTDIAGVIKSVPLLDLSFGVNGVSGQTDLAGKYVSEDD